MRALRGGALAWAVVDQITQHPETHQQGSWWCGTGGCFAGWTVKLAGEEPAVLLGDGYEDISDRALDLLEVQASELDFEPDDTGYSRWMFSSDTTMPEIIETVTRVFGPRPGGEAVS